MQIEIHVLTANGATYTTAAGQSGQLGPGARLVLSDPVSITINAPAGEAAGEAVQPNPASL